MGRSALTIETGESLVPLVKFPDKYRAGLIANVVHVIHSFKIVGLTIGESLSKVSVEYQYLGATDILTFSKPKERMRVFEIKLIKKNGNWKIDKPLLAPHVGPKAEIDHLIRKQVKFPKDKERLGSIIEQIGEAEENFQEVKR